MSIRASCQIHPVVHALAAGALPARSWRHLPSPRLITVAGGIGSRVRHRSAKQRSIGPLGIPSGRSTLDEPLIVAALGSQC